MGQDFAAFLELSLGGKKQVRIELDVFESKFPKTGENFRKYISGELGPGKQYKGCQDGFHRVIQEFMIQGGVCNNKMGWTGQKFADETLPGGKWLPHDGKGCLSMANRGPNTNGSQFFITFDAQPHLDGKHCVFGKVRSQKDLDVLDLIDQQVASSSGQPRCPVEIIDCGIIS